MAEFTVKIGQQFEIDAVDVEDELAFLAAASDAAEKADDARTRGHTLIVLGLSAGLALAVATWLGVTDGSFDEVDAVWSAIAFPLGMVMERYFVNRTRKFHSENDH